MDRVISLIGLLVMIAVAVMFSNDRKKINWRTVISGVCLQIFFGLLILKTSWGKEVFEAARLGFQKILDYTNAGSSFVFGSLTDVQKTGFIFMTMVLPTVLFMSSLMNVLYHLGIMQKVIKATAWVMMRVMGTSGAESLAAAANIFAGQTEAPLVVKPYLSTMTKSELLSLMTGGMATVAGGVLAAYVGFGIDAGHLLAASVMSAPAALVCAKILLPEAETPETTGNTNMEMSADTVNLIDAAASGASEGMSLAINIAAMLIAFIALVALVNGMLGFAGSLVGIDGLSMELITGYLFSPFAFLMGVPWDECRLVGVLLGKKLILNEFVAYLDLKTFISEGSLSPRSIAISTYALCGFANFSSIAIQVGGIGVLAPNRREDLARLGVRSLIGGTLACFMTACIAGILL